VAAASALGAPLVPDNIIIYGARQHNLKNIDITIPRYRFVVVTGVSGSGKSSLAFDTLYAEGQRRYVESLSSYARQFLGQMEKPKVDHITGLAPAIAIEQKTVSRNPRSTVGTVTEVLDYMRVLYANIGQPHCPQCGRGVEPQSPLQIAELLLALPEGTRLQLLAPVVRRRKGTHADLLKQVRRDGYIRARVDGEIIDLTAEQELPKLQKTKFHNIELIVDRLKVPAPSEQSDSFRTRLIDSVETTLKAGKGLLIVLLENDEEMVLSEHNACPHCDISFPELSPQLFSFNSPTGMCPDCNGLGIKLSVDPDRIIVNPEISLIDGASSWYGNMREKKRSWFESGLSSIATHYGVDLELPWKELPQKFRDVLLHGSGEERIKFTHEAEWDGGSWKGESVRSVQGIVANITRLFRQTKSEGRRRFYLQFMSDQSCPTCNGERLCAEARFTTEAASVCRKLLR
jgi:excinuclease ABC subunit A